MLLLGSLNLVWSKLGTQFVLDRFADDLFALFALQKHVA